eukprot:11988503-Ditylum_brightwellii.AAC.1
MDLDSMMIPLQRSQNIFWHILIKEQCTAACWDYSSATNCERIDRKFAFLGIVKHPCVVAFASV